MEVRSVRVQVSLELIMPAYIWAHLREVSFGWSDSLLLL